MNLIDPQNPVTEKKPTSTRRKFIKRALIAGFTTSIASGAYAHWVESFWLQTTNLDCSGLAVKFEYVIGVTRLCLRQQIDYVIRRTCNNVIDM